MLMLTNILLASVKSKLFYCWLLITDDYLLNVNFADQAIDWQEDGGHHDERDNTH